jgi:hypothetical protein
LSRAGARSPVGDESSESTRRSEAREAGFQAVLLSVLERPEIATQLRRTPGVERSDLEAHANRSAETLWASAIGLQEHAEALADELERLRWRLRRPAMQAAHELVAHPALQAAAAIAGLLLVAASFGSELLPGGDASGWSRFLYGIGGLLLVLGLLAAISGYLQTSVVAKIRWAAPSLLYTLTGCATAALGIVEAYRLAQFRTEARVLFAAALLADAAVAGVAIFRNATAGRAQRASVARSVAEERATPSFLDDVGGRIPILDDPDQ